MHRLTLAVLLSFSVVACEDRTIQNADDSGIKVDVGADVAQLPPPDAKTPDLSPPPPVLMQTVMSDIRFPITDKEYAIDLDGDGFVDNALSDLLMELRFGLATPLPFGEIVTRLFGANVDYLLFELAADGFEDSRVARLRVLSGTDADGDADNNFDGTGKFRISGDASQQSVLDGAMRDGQLVVKGQLLLPMTSGRGMPLGVSNARVEVDRVEEDGLELGEINGALSAEVMQNTLIPAILDVFNGGGVARENIVELDTDGDGTISARELQANDTMAEVLALDLDLDGDGTPDAFSIGVGFEAARCTILP